MQNHKESLLDVLKTLYRWKTYIIVTSVLAGLVAVIYCLVIPNYYKSTTVFYPSNPQIASRGALFGGADENMDFFGGSAETNRILNIAQSSELVSYVVKKFDLYAHYEIDSTDLEAPHYVTRDFYKLYNIKKNTENALELSIEDTNREQAADMLWAVVGKINEINNRLTKENQRKILASFKNSLDTKQNEYNAYTDTIGMLRTQYGIVSLEAQEEFLTSLVTETEAGLTSKRARLKVLEKNNGSRDTIRSLRSSVQALESQLQSLTSSDSESNFNLSKFNEGRDKVGLLEMRQLNLSQEINFLRDRSFQYQTVYDTNVFSLYITEPPSVPVVRSRPRRTITVLSAGLIAFILSSLGVLLLDYYKDVNWQEIRE